VLVTVIVFPVTSRRRRGTSQWNEDAFLKEAETIAQRLSVGYAGLYRRDNGWRALEAKRAFGSLRVCLRYLSKWASAIVSNDHTINRQARLHLDHTHREDQNSQLKWDHVTLCLAAKPSPDCAF
jgi:hypothetical protein